MNRQYACIDQTPRRTTRREMLKLGAAAAAGTALAGVSVPRVHAAEENTIRLALIGCGGRGRGDEIRNSAAASVVVGSVEFRLQRRNSGLGSCPSQKTHPRGTGLADERGESMGQM